MQACRAGFDSVTVHQFRECSSTARIRARHARDTGSTPVTRSNFKARSSTAEPAAHNGQVARSTRAAPTSVHSGVEQRQLVWLITRRLSVRIPPPRPIRRDSKGSPCAPLKPATSGCDPWSRHHLPVSFKRQYPQFPNWRCFGSNPATRSILLAASNQGECTALLKRPELGSIPRLPAISPACSGNNADSKPAKERSIPLRRCHLCAAGRSVRRQIAAAPC